MQLSAKELAALLGGTVEGNADVYVQKPSKIEEGGEGTVSFLGNMKYESYLYSSTATVVIVSNDFVPKDTYTPTLIRVKDVYAAVSQLLERFSTLTRRSEAVISEKACIDTNAQLGNQVSVGHFSVIEAGADIGENTHIASQVYIGKNVKIGKGSIIHPGTRILNDCVIGNHCVLHPNVIIGSDGFGFAPLEDGSYKKVPQTGNVVLEDHVEIGSNTTIDRATLGSTIIREGVKLDNLIQVGHNVEIGKNTVIAAQAGIAGSTKIGPSCRIGGQVGMVGHIQIAEGTQIQAQSGIASSIKKPFQALFGSPAIDYRTYIKAYAGFKQLPDLMRRLARIEKKIDNQLNQ